MTSSIVHFQTTLGSAGLKVSASSVLDLADPLYDQVPEEIRAAAWLAAMNQGWTVGGIRLVIRHLMDKRYDDDTANLVLSQLEEAAKKHPNIL